MRILAIFLANVTKPLIGGQAVIEGVMMRSPKSFAIAVRKNDNSILIKESNWASLSQKYKVLRLPLLRGATMLVESLYNGINALQFSAEEAMDDLESEKTKTKKHKSKKSQNIALIATMVFSLIAGIAIFKAIPHFLTFGIGLLLGQNGQNALPVTSVAFHLLDGIIKLSMFVGYILLISCMKDVKRLFMYHGAEHKSVHVWEKNLELNVENAKKQSTAHPRCGTSLVLLVLSISIVIFALIIPVLPQVSDNNIVQIFFTFIIKVPLMLPVAGIAYEFQRAAAKNPDNYLIKAFIAPGMLMQKLTTKEPDESQLEVALSALRKAVWREEQATSSAAVAAKNGKRADTVEVFPDFANVCNNI